MRRAHASCWTTASAAALAWWIACAPSAAVAQEAHDALRELDAWAVEDACLSRHDVELARAGRALVDDTVRSWFIEALEGLRFVAGLCRGGSSPAAPRGAEAEPSDARVRDAIERTRALGSCVEARARLERVDTSARSSEGARRDAWMGVRGRAVEVLERCERAAALPSSAGVVRITRAPRLARPALAAAASALRGCHREGLLDAPGEQGSVRLRFALASDGARLTDTHVSGSVSRRTARCLVEVLSHLAWSDALGPSLSVTLRLVPWSSR